MAFLLPFATAAVVGLLLLDDGADYALPTAAAFGTGGVIGQLIQMRWPKQPKPPAWPAETAPPQRRD
jgi:hypothetical protein